MPIYEYVCQDCGNNFEKLIRRQGDVEALVCPSCGEKHLKQALSTFAAHGATQSGSAPANFGGCPAGMCQNPGLCGRN